MVITIILPDCYIRLKWYEFLAKRFLIAFLRWFVIVIVLLFIIIFPQLNVGGLLLFKGQGCLPLSLMLRSLGTKAKKISSLPACPIPPLSTWWEASLTDEAGDGEREMCPHEGEKKKTLIHQTNIPLRILRCYMRIKPLLRKPLLSLP